MKQYLYRYAVLRFIPDTLTQEFVNIGVVVFSYTASYFKASLNNRYGRISNLFHGIDGNHYRRVIHSIEHSIEKIQQSWQQGKLFTTVPEDFSELLNQVLPPDDSSLSFMITGGGIAEELDQELAELYSRLVTKYETKADDERRNDAQVWRIFEHEFQKYEILTKLNPVRITTSTFEYEFRHAWKNERWHPVEAVSLDLVHPASIASKATKWIGNAISLKDSGDLGTLYLLLGKPQDSDLIDSYRKAVLNLRSHTPNVRIIEEDKAREFSEEFAAEIASH